MAKNKTFMLAGLVALLLGLALTVFSVEACMKTREWGKKTDTRMQEVQTAFQSGDIEGQKQYSEWLTDDLDIYRSWKSKMYTRLGFGLPLLIIGGGLFFYGRKQKPVA